MPPNQPTHLLREQEELQNRLRQQGAVAELGLAALKTGDLASVMTKAAQIVSHILDNEHCKVLELLPDGKSLLLRAGVGWREGLVGHATVGAGLNSQAGCTLQTSEPVIVDNLRTETRFNAPPLLASHGVVSGMTVIIHGRDRPYGVLGTHTTRRRQFSKDDINFLQSIANVLAAFVQRRQAEEELQRRDTDYRLALQAVSDAVWVWDMVTNRVSWSDTLGTVFGHKAEEVGPDLSWFLENVHPDEREEIVGVCQTLVGSDEEFWQGEYRFRRGDGSYAEVFDRGRIVREGGRPVRMVGSLIDLTQQKRQTEELRLRDRAIRAVSQGILITDPNQPDNPIIYASPGFERLTGYPAQEVAGRNCRFLQGKDTDPSAVARLRGAIQRGEPCEVELLNHRKDSEPFWNHVAISPVRDEAGRLTHFVGVQTDVTERRKLEGQFRQAQKMEAVGRLAGGVAHDFNNLLTVINGYSELILARLQGGDPLRELVSEIHKAGERAGTLTRQLLMFSRRSVLEPKVTDINSVLSDTENMLRRLIGEDIALGTALEPTLAPVKLDPGQLQQAVINLSVNARDAMPRGGKLTIETRNVEMTADDCHGSPDCRPGRYVLLAVSDTGHGMDEATKARIFDPFFTTKEPGKGTGLGLAMVYGFVKASDGFITVYSEAGRGATFKMYFPQVRERVSSGKSFRGLVKMPAGTETVLLVEDDDAVRALSLHVLKACGYTVLEAADGGEAVRMAQSHQGPIHLLVTDVVMPCMGGREVAERLEAIRPGIKVLYCSGYTDDAVVRHGVLEEGVAFVQKPYSPSSLALKVREVLDEKR